MLDLVRPWPNGPHDATVGTVRPAVGFDADRAGGEQPVHGSLELGLTELGRAPRRPPRETFGVSCAGSSHGVTTPALSPLASSTRQVALEAGATVLALPRSTRKYDSRSRLGGFWLFGIFGIGPPYAPLS